MQRLLRFLAVGLVSLASASAFQIPSSSTQCVVGTAKDWNNSYVTLALWQRDSGGPWKQVGPTWSGRLGRDGLVWGRGMSPAPSGAKLKNEGDWRAPAGVFSIGGAWGNDAAINKKPGLFYRKVTSRDLWVEDPASKDYNKNVILDHEPSTAWEKKQQMKQDDPAHKIKLFIAHNAPPRVTPGGGSSIFFHVWRADGTKPTAGCTTMPEAKLRWLISSIDPARNPVYVLLPATEYQAKRAEWKLP
ncbi:L,D-transpeptidase family protein [Luteolibacter ambystomatis]|uniref:L,D-transpeptidase family protein n=1 Tax=Luteolibacter ambystomatis TaxID=2824561 RepID=A0A975PF67_9BACT|nr:L,D-transpeptidase family protein [Luteolibacter ambystomatis]QUE51849.1 L,D-transpeptidase family protein [Luteolibacter ambystomatis]